MFLAAALLLITVWFDGAPAQCLVDTGAVQTVLTQSTAAQVRTLAQTSQEMTLAAANGTLVVGRLHYVRNVTTEHLAWPGTMVMVVPDTQLTIAPCVLGVDLLGQQPIVVDWRVRQVRPFEAATAALDTLPAEIPGYAAAMAAPAADSGTGEE